MLGWLDNKRLGTKLPLIVVILVSITIGVTTVANMLLTQNVIKHSAEERLEGLASLTAARVSDLLAQIEREIQVASTTPTSVQAMTAFADGFNSTPSPSETLQRIFITENPHPIGQKEKLTNADTGSNYGYIHKIYHAAYARVQKQMGYYDLFFIDIDGNVVYSVFKESDFATNLLTGKWQDSGLAEAFRLASQAQQSDQTIFLDFAPYGPSNLAPASFFARPIFNNQGKRLGVIAVQMPIDVLNEVASSLPGQGTTADAFVVGPDGVFRTDSALSEQDDVLATSLSPQALSAMSNGATGNFEGPGHVSEHVKGFIAPIKFAGAQWRSVIQQDVDELLAGQETATLQSALISLLILAAVAGASFFISRRISKPVQQLAASVNDVAEGHLDTPVAGDGRLDEIGDLARAAEIFRQNAIKMEELNAQQRAAQAQMETMNKEREKASEEALNSAREREEAERENTLQRQKMMRQLGESFGLVVDAAVAGQFSERVVVDFDDETLITLATNMNQLMQAVDQGLSTTGTLLGRVAGGDLTQRMEGNFQGAFAGLQQNVNRMIDSLTQMAGEISDSGQTLKGSSDELRQTADRLSRQAEQNAASVEETSAALEELAASIKSASGNVAEVRETAGNASASAQASETIAAEAAGSMDRIAAGSAEITRVTDVINDIAFQINLLALNAGVEAARAGDAGRGFSVVASEVRQLAQRASDAAREIGDVIKQSDAAVAEGVTKVSSAKTSLENIAKSVFRISHSITEVSTAISEQSSGIGEITSAVAQIDSNTQKQAAAFEEVTASSHLLAEEARELERTTARFKTTPAALAASTPTPGREGLPGTQAA